MKRTVTYLATFCVIALVCNVASAEWLADNSYTTGFENPPWPSSNEYVGGDAYGQGWTTESAASVHVCHLQSGGGNEYEGVQYLEIKNTAVNKIQTTRHTLDAPTGADTPVSLKFSLLSHWDWMNDAANYFEIFVEGANAGESRAILTINGTDGSEIRIRSGAGWHTVSGYSVTKAVWGTDNSGDFTHFDFLIDPTAGTYDIAINGDTYTTDVGLGETYANGVNSIAFVAPAQERIQGIVLENYSLGPVPEPVTLVILALGGLAGLLRRRR